MSVSVVGWGAVGAFAGTVVGGLISADASRDASKAGQRSAANELEYLRNRDLQARSDSQPFRESGYNALNAMNTMTGLERELSGEQQDELDRLWGEKSEDGTYGLTPEQQAEVDAITKVPAGYSDAGIQPMFRGLRRRNAIAAAKGELTDQYKRENKLAYGDLNKEDFYAQQKEKMLGPE